jgi:hypothetical protein
VNKDIGDILKNWDYNPKSDFIRIIIGDDNKEKIQVRVSLGILQMEADGRPDGKRPNGEESLLDYYEKQIANSKKSDGENNGFSLTEQDLKDLDVEIMQYYNRRVCFFAINDYIRAKRDAEHNLCLMDIIKKYCDDKDYVENHEQYRPFVIMERTRAAGLESLKNKDYAIAMDFINDAIEKIHVFYGERGYNEENVERRHELILLKKWREKIHQDWEGGVADIDEDNYNIQ